MEKNTTLLKQYQMTCQKHRHMSCLHLYNIQLFLVNRQIGCVKDIFLQIKANQINNCNKHRRGSDSFQYRQVKQQILFDKI